MTSTKDWVSGMLMGISECLECEGYRLTYVTLPPVVWNNIAIQAIGVGLQNARPEAIKLAVGSGEVELRRGQSMAIGWWAVPA